MAAECETIEGVNCVRDTHGKKQMETAESVGTHWSLLVLSQGSASFP